MLIAGKDITLGHEKVGALVAVVLLLLFVILRIWVIKDGALAMVVTGLALASAAALGWFAKSSISSL